jgi:hypothetical protein
MTNISIIDLKIDLFHESPGKKKTTPESGAAFSLG